jgi:subtilisin family serine protease
MKKIFFVISMSLLFFSGGVAAIELQTKGKPQNASSARTENLKPYVPGEILVKYRPSADIAVESDLQSRHGLTAKKKLPAIGTTVYKLPQGMEVQAALTLLRDDPRVAYAEPNYYARPTIDPNDPSFPVQWGLNNTGQAVSGVSGVPDADIDGPEAWNLNTGHSGIVIAVIDTGVDILHPDIKPNLWVNTGELDGFASIDTWQPNGLDDDGNGYVDDIVGWDFFFNVNNPNDEVSGHGTHVAGIAAARGNNGAGVTGVSWEARIMALATQDYADGGLPISAVANALVYAESMGAHVINMSLGLYQDSTPLRDAINSVTRAVIVCAAGNDGTDNDIRPHYPSSYPNANLIAVTATNQSDQLTSFSNVGLSSVDVAAPGTRIYSTISRFVDAGGYGFLGGTSQATPMVAGLAVLLRAANGDLVPTQVVSIIKNSADGLPTLTNRIATGGRINAQRALQSAGSGGGSDGGDDGCFIRAIKAVP